MAAAGGYRVAHTPHGPRPRECVGNGRHVHGLSGKPHTGGRGVEHPPLHRGSAKRGPTRARDGAANGSAGVAAKHAACDRPRDGHTECRAAPPLGDTRPKAHYPKREAAPFALYTSSMRRAPLPGVIAATLPPAAPGDDRAPGRQVRFAHRAVAADDGARQSL